MWWPISVFVRWCGRRRVLSKLAFYQEVAEARARIAMAPSRVKAEIEWDMRWASPLDKTWRDEILMVIFGAPLLGLWIPGLREWFQQGFDMLKAFDPNAPSLYLWSWAIIFASVFGMKSLKSLFLPGRLAGLVREMGSRNLVSGMDEETAQDAASPLNPPLSNEGVSENE